MTWSVADVAMAAIAAHRNGRARRRACAINRCRVIVDVVIVVSFRRVGVGAALLLADIECR
jgi:hypothetical protein